MNCSNSSKKKKTMTNVVVEKQINALNDSLINAFRQGISSSHEVRSPNANIFLVCQICNLVDHVANICSKIKVFKPKCDKWGLPHRIVNCGVGCGYYTNMGHTENICWKKGKETKSHLAINNYV